MRKHGVDLKDNPTDGLRSDRRDLLTPIWWAPYCSEMVRLVSHLKGEELWKATARAIMSSCLPSPFNAVVVFNVRLTRSRFGYNLTAPVYSMTKAIYYLRQGQVNPAGCVRVSPALFLHECSLVGHLAFIVRHRFTNMPQPAVTMIASLYRHLHGRPVKKPKSHDFAVRSDVTMLYGYWGHRWHYQKLRVERGVPTPTS
jgi:hypothetical protein